MANRLKMAKITSILTLHEQGWSARRIARELAVDRETVRRYIRGPDPKRAKAPSGFERAQFPKTAEMLEISPRKVDLIWAYARAWLRRNKASA